MAPDGPCHAVPSKPQLLRFIIALFLVKSKTTNTPVRDHLAQLRSWIAQGRRADTSTDVHSHVDALGFWKDAHKKSEETVMELRARIFELERRCERQDEQMSQASTVAAAQKKRKRVVAESRESSNSRALKQARTTATAQPEDALLPVSMDEWEDSAPGTDSKVPFAIHRMLEADMLATTLLHNIYLLQEVRSQQNSPAQELASALLRLSNDISRMISTITPSTVIEKSTNVNSTTRAQERTVTKIQTDVDSKLNSKSQAVARIFRWLLNSGDILDRTPAGKALQSKVVYSFIKVFQDLLERICDLAASHYTQNTSKDGQNISKLRATKPKTAIASAKDDKTTPKLCRLLTTMAASLDPSNPMHQNIIDGLLFFLLKRVGLLLSVFIFSDDTIATPTASPIQSQNKTTTTHLSQGSSIQESQAPHLISLLSHLMPLIAHPSPLLLAEKAKLKLQHTLLNAVFGAQTGEFVHALREPCSPLDNLDADADVHVLAIREDGNVGDWFKHEVWKCVGWDVLANHIAWPEEKI